MKEDKLEMFRKTVILITMILIFSTAGLLVISSQVKTIVFNYYGEIKTIKTLASTVDGFLLQNNISVGEEDEVLPSMDSKITNGMEIKVKSIYSLSKLDLDEIKGNYVPMVAKIEEVVESILFEEEKKDNPIINRGATSVIQDGENGEKVTRYLVKYNNNEEVTRACLGEKVILEAQNKIIEVGTKISQIVSRSQVVTSVQSDIVDEGFRAYNIKLPVEQQQYAYNISKRYGIQYELFLAVMYKESGYNPNAVGGGNSYGLCQIHITNHANLRSKLGISNYYDPYDNMTAGAYMLALYFGTARTKVSDEASVEAYALNAYNMGDGAFYSICFSKGILHREYSNSIRSIRDRLIQNGGI